MAGTKSNLANPDSRLATERASTNLHRRELSEKAIETALSATSSTQAEVEPAQELDDNQIAEAGLISQIEKIWRLHNAEKISVRKRRVQLANYRLNLARCLSEYKQQLVRTGRGGRWASFLREKNIPLSTADRYVAQHERRQNPGAEKLLTEELSPATPQEIRQFVSKHRQKLSRFASTSEGKASLLECIYSLSKPQQSLTGSNRPLTEPVFEMSSRDLGSHPSPQ